MDGNLNAETNLDTPPPKQLTILGTIVLVGSLRILQGLGVSLPIALFFSGVLDLCVTYWIPPRSRVPFPRYALTTMLTLLGFIVAFWPSPELLRRLLPVELAYALPAFFFSLSLYAMPILQSGKRWHYEKDKQDISFVKWIIGCAVFSIIVGSVVMILGIVRRHW